MHCEVNPSTNKITPGTNKLINDKDKRVKMIRVVGTTLYEKD